MFKKYFKITLIVIILSVFFILSGCQDKSYKIVFESNGGSEVAPITYLAGDKFDLPTNPTKTGHSFKAWYYDQELKALFDESTPIKNNLTLYAKCDLNSYQNMPSHDLTLYAKFEPDLDYKEMIP